MKVFLQAATAGVLAASAIGPAAAQTTATANPAAHTTAGLTAELSKATTQVEKKFVDLGAAMTDAQFNWRPGAGVRSVGEVLLHVSADNYFMPAILGTPAPAATGITATDFAAMQKYEKRALSKDATIADVKESFVHLRKSIEAMPESRMNETLAVFGQSFTVREFLVMTMTHLHEHLGQLIAYARMNNVTPPWSR